MSRLLPPPAGCLLVANESTMSCLHRGGFFYDACTGRCEHEMSFLRLSQHLQLEHFVYGYLFPVLVLLVVVANLLVVLVLSQRHMLSPTNLVLKYMAIADLCVGLFPLPWNFYYHTLRHFEREQRELQLWWCYAYKYSMDTLPPVCHNIAMWLTVLLAGQRYVSIRHPVNSRHLCSVRNVRIATLVITVVSLVCGLPKSMDYHFEVYQGWAFVDSGHLVHLRSCLSGFTGFVKLVGSNAFFNAYFWTRVVAFILLPSLLLICLNALLIRSIQRAQQRKRRLLMEKRNREAQRQTDSNSTSAMLVIIVSIFLVVNLPQALFMAMLCVYNTLGLSNRFLEGMFPVTFLLVNNMLVMASYPINFGIYCFMSSSFRDTFRMLFCNCSGNKYWLARPLLGSKRVPSLGGVPSEVTRISLGRRSTDLQQQQQQQQNGGMSAGQLQATKERIAGNPPPFHAAPPRRHNSSSGQLGRREHHNVQHQQQQFSFTPPSSRSSSILTGMAPPNSVEGTPTTTVTAIGQQRHRILMRRRTSPAGIVVTVIRAIDVGRRQQQQADDNSVLPNQQMDEEEEPTMIVADGAAGTLPVPPLSPTSTIFGETIFL